MVLYLPLLPATCRCLGTGLIQERGHYSTIHQLRVINSTRPSHVVLKDDGNTMHVQPSLPEVGVHGEDGFPVGGELGLSRVFGSIVL